MGRIGQLLYYHGQDAEGNGIFLPYPRHHVEKFDRAPAVWTDEIDPWTFHGSHDAPVFTSRSKRDRHLKETGFAIKEKGMFEKPVAPGNRISKEEIRDMAEQSYYDCKYARVPFSEMEKEVCKREEREYQEFKKRREK